MTNQQHPITPTPELVQEWWESTIPNQSTSVKISAQRCTKAAQWGADQELTACLRYAGANGLSLTRMQAARRPKQPSLKEQALQVLASAPGPDYFRVMTVLNADEHALIRQALEALND
jgi:hypothetical protein